MMVLVNESPPPPLKSPSHMAHSLYIIFVKYTTMDCRILGGRVNQDIRVTVSSSSFVCPSRACRQQYHLRSRSLVHKDSHQDHSQQ